MTDDTLLKPDRDSWPSDGLKARGITVDTMRKCGIFTAGFSGQRVQVYPYFSHSGEPAGQKLRLPNKEFVYLKASEGEPLGKCKLFMQPYFGDRYDRQVVICEGELDAATVAQETDFKIAVTSLTAGAQSAVACLKANYLWLDRFEDIVLWFDNDEPGQLAAEECAKLFKVGKVRLAKAQGELKGKPCKDASDMLQAGLPGDIKVAIYTAPKGRPKGIVNAKDTPEDVCKPKDDGSAFAYDWPWEGLNEMLGPMLPGQVCYHVAGTSIGKSTAIAEIEMKLYEQGCKVGHMGFEDTRRDAKLRLLTVKNSKRLDLEQLSDDEMISLHNELFSQGSFELFDPESAEWSVDAILGYVRYMAKALDCKVIFIDPLTFIAAGLAQGDDERRALDSASRDLAAFAKELGVNIQVCHHLRRPAGTAHEEGAPTSLNEVRGSGGIANFATTVIGHERNTQAGGDDWTITQLRILKNRKRSRTGPAVTLQYHLDTGRLMPTKTPFPDPGKTTGGKAQGSPFSPISSDDY